MSRARLGRSPASAAPASADAGERGRQPIAGPHGPEDRTRESLSADDLLLWRRQLLAEGGSPAAFDWLLDLAGGLSWSDLQALRLHPARLVCLRMQCSELERLWRRHRSTAEPLQYLVGLCPWRDLTLQVAPGVLIPRQETELLADLALSCVEGSASPQEPFLWADLGTGSGCLALALARALPRSRGFAVDASPEALIVAATNLAAEVQAERVVLVQSHWWQSLEPWWGRLQLVISNPPYIPSATVATLEAGVRDHEPRQALDGGADGLGAIREILAGASTALAPGGWLFVEHHHDQSGEVLSLMHQAGLRDPYPHRDLEGNLRFASARRQASPGQSDG